MRRRKSRIRSRNRSCKSRNRMGKRKKRRKQLITAILTVSVPVQDC